MGAVLIGLGRSPMASRLLLRATGALLLLALLTSLAAPPMRAAAADETVACAVCGKQVKKSKAIKVVKDGKVYYVCSDECRVKLMNAKAKKKKDKE